jgi:hypothetical protein
MHRSVLSSSTTTTTTTTRRTTINFRREGIGRNHQQQQQRRRRRRQQLNIKSDALSSSSSFTSSFDLDSSAKAGLIIVLVRLLTLTGGKAAISKQLEDVERKAKEKNVDVSDLYYDSDQGEDKWYLVGDWKPPKKGDLKFGNGRSKEEIKYRIRLAEAITVAESKGVEYEDIVENIETQTAKKFVDLRMRIRERTNDNSFDVIV